MTGEPRWFNPSVKSDNLGEIAEVETIDKGIILRSLPLYLLNDDQCFPTGFRNLHSFLFTVNRYVSDLSYYYRFKVTNCRYPFIASYLNLKQKSLRETDLESR